jgi:hypothetical protein
MKITKDILKQMIAEEASILQEAFGARSTGMDSMFIGQSGDSGGRSYMSFEDKQEVRDKLRAKFEKEGHDWLLGEEPFTDAIEKIGYDANTKEDFLSGIVDYLNSENFQSQHGYGAGFGDELNLKEEKGLKAKIRKAHKEEGGAAGMDALEKHTKASAKDIKAAVKDMDDVGQHKDGDYIQGDGKKIQIAKEQLSEVMSEVMSEVFGGGITVLSPKEAHKEYLAHLKDYKEVAAKISLMLPEEKVEEGTKAVDETQYAIEEMMELVKFALENQGMSQQQKEELRDKANEIDYNDEYDSDGVKRILVLVNPTPEELENLVDDLVEKYEVAEAYLRGILEGRYKDVSDADLEDAGKQMGLGLQEESKKDLLKRIVAEEIAKMEIEAVLKEEHPNSEKE